VNGRLLFFLILPLTLLVVSCAGRTEEQNEARQRAVALVEKYGGEIQYASGIDKAIVTVWLGDKPVSDRELADLVGLKRVEYIDLYGTPIGDEGLQHLAQIPSINELQLSRTKVTDKGLRQLASMPNLVGLHVHNTAVTDDGAEQLRKALPNVRVSRSRVVEPQNQDSLPK